MEVMLVSSCGLHLQMFLLLSVLASIASVPAAQFGDKRKNVLILIGDDLGFESQVYNNTVCKTPNINSLAKRSVTFSNAFTFVSSCSPSRSAILTGGTLILAIFKTGNGNGNGDGESFTGNL